MNHINDRPPELEIIVSQSLMDKVPPHITQLVRYISGAGPENENGYGLNVLRLLTWIGLTCQINEKQLELLTKLNTKWEDLTKKLLAQAQVDSATDKLFTDSNNS